MKKIVWIALVLMFIVSGCSSKSNDKSLFVDSKTILDKIEADETFVFYVGSTTCSACTAYKPVVKEMNKNYDVNLLTVYLDEDSNTEARQQLIELVSLEGTPTTVVIEKGEIKKSFIGLMEYTDLKKFLVNNGVLSE